MSARATPPFRADQVGSLLRPAEIKKARAVVERGEMTAEQLRAIEVDQPERMLSLVENFLQRSEGFMVNWGTLALDAG